MSYITRIDTSGTKAKCEASTINYLPELNASCIIEYSPNYFEENKTVYIEHFISAYIIDDYISVMGIDFDGVILQIDAKLDMFTIKKYTAPKPSKEELLAINLFSIAHSIPVDIAKKQWANLTSQVKEVFVKQAKFVYAMPSQPNN